LGKGTQEAKQNFHAKSNCGLAKQKTLLMQGRIFATKMR
jgi:hypothetical protein